MRGRAWGGFHPVPHMAVSLEELYTHKYVNENGVCVVAILLDSLNSETVK